MRAQLRDGLVDELHLIVYPLALGTGKRLCPMAPTPTKLALKEHETALCTFPTARLRDCQLRSTPNRRIASSRVSLRLQNAKRTR